MFLLLSGFAFDQRDPHAATALILVVAVSHVAMSFPNFCSVLGACSIFGNAVCRATWQRSGQASAAATGESRGQTKGKGKGAEFTGGSGCIVL